jgi:hypothetical protein
MDEDLFSTWNMHLILGSLLSSHTSELELTQDHLFPQVSVCWKTLVSIEKSDPNNGAMKSIIWVYFL